MSILKTHYLENVVPKLQEKFAYKNPQQIPKIEKIQVNMGLGLNAQNRVFFQKAIEEIRTITGQHPLITVAKKSVAGFKVREEMPLGLTVTLRREKMYAFLEKLIKLAFPRIRDFRGFRKNQFDRYGNYNLGISDQLVFPEIDYDNVESRRGFNISIVTTSQTIDEGIFLLQELGFPFAD
jgi:large subunit ribosomal protein L5